MCLLYSVGSLGLTTPAISAEGPKTAHATAAAQALRDGQHDFDFNIGSWKVHVSRLRRPLSGSTDWLQYDGVANVRGLWEGRANLLELAVQGQAGRIEGAGLRLYNPESRQWSLNWASADAGVMTSPMIGEFKDGRGEFFSHELFEGRGILVRNSFSDITAASAHFEQAFSNDGGKTWEANWIMTFTR